ncbi:hypothetical protein F511_24350 [Dorcoceras hygrometricum]|uniref:Uncharacterized protein n=1 Tax=Dorcoceras hygrometricum TaxID=472368 RepID=A0A2Z7D9E9_9LAMI|nr:hypothetical protein F511_24350 [Dorcoceras hygrometricum]
MTPKRLFPIATGATSMYSPHVHSRPKNLKISKSIKTGPISNIDPKTSRAARDRPELNPRKQTSRRSAAVKSPVGSRPPAATTSATRSARPRASLARQRASSRMLLPTLAQPVAFLPVTIAQPVRGCQHPVADLRAPSCGKRTAQRPIFMRHRAASARCCGRSSWPRCATRAHTIARAHACASAGSNCIDQIRTLALIPLLGNNGVGSGSRLPGHSRKQNCPGDDQYNKIQTQYEPFIGCFSGYYLAGVFAPGSDQFHEETGTSRPDKIGADGFSSKSWPEQIPARGGGGGGGGFLGEEGGVCITDSACKNQLVVVSVQYGPFNPYIPIRSTTIGKSRVVIDPIAMHTSWRSNSDIASVTRCIDHSRTQIFKFFRCTLGAGSGFAAAPTLHDKHRLKVYLHSIDEEGSSHIDE